MTELSEQPKVSTSNLYEPGLANRISELIPAMPLATLKKHAVDYDNMFRLYEQGKIRLTQSDRMEIAEAIKHLNDRIDELLPKVPANIEAHDHLQGDRIAERWPDDISQATSSMHVHMHFCELINAWKLNPIRNQIHNGEISIDEWAETQGLSRFAFTNHTDAGDFVDHYGLSDFVYSLTTSPDAQGFCYLVLSNKFAREDVAEFLNIYNAAINALTIIYDERRRAVSMDNGKFGYITADHFTARENIELIRLQAARERLGVSFGQVKARQ